MPVRLIALTASLAASALLAMGVAGINLFAAQLETAPQDRACARTDAGAAWKQPPQRDGVYPQLVEGPPAAVPAQRRTEVATFGMGCFWGAEAEFCSLDGVIDTEVGYAGGWSPDPDYRQVATGTTGHAEVVQVRFDPSVVAYEELLEVFWRAHDPTTPNRQGPDVGPQYRSLILYHDPGQERAALASRERQARRLSRPVVTEIVAAGRFHPAEDYHQRYLERRGRASCNR